ncbi:MAG: sodium-dependent transporter [Cyclobacteriaceae bacterium]|nr:sodium-dependent transporter [Cyclobacteriaceae bacterium]
MSIPSTENRGQWGSRFGFIMSAAGSAIGLGNIWRFPYLTGEHGGGAFVFVYLSIVLLIGVPLLFTEIGLGRLTRKSTIGAFRDTGAGPVWLGFGAILALLVSFFVLSYYSVIAGWTIGYVFKSLSGSTSSFASFAANPLYTIPLLGVVIAITISIVLGGISGGIEKATKVLMPALLILILVVALRSVTLDGAWQGVVFYLTPDFSKITANTILAALGQAFFSLSIGWGIMVTYGSYLSKQTNIVSSAVWVGLMDTTVALLAGLMIFPAVFAFGKSPEAGPTLVFQVLPEVFRAIPGGAIVGAVFFLILMVAAITSTISMLEVPASYFIDEKKWKRKKASILIGILAFLVGVPAALSSGGSEYFSNMTLRGLDVNAVSTTVKPINGHYHVVLTGAVKQENVNRWETELKEETNTEFTGTEPSDEHVAFVFRSETSANAFADKIGNLNRGFLSILDYYFGTFFIIVVAFTTCIYAGWKMNIKDLVTELGEGSATFRKTIWAQQAYIFFIRFVCPLLILAVLLNMMGVFNFG